MPTTAYPPIPIEASVRTTKPNRSLRHEWTNEAWCKRRWGVEGCVVEYSDSHGLCYAVQHRDGIIAWYDPSELQAIP